jgi:hypothetical protein
MIACHQARTDGAKRRTSGWSSRFHHRTGWQSAVRVWNHRAADIGNGLRALTGAALPNLARPKRKVGGVPIVAVIYNEERCARDSAHIIGSDLA